MTREWRIVGVALAAIAVGVAGCASKDDSRGDETHFQNCTTDSDCRDGGPEARCVVGTCTVPAAGTGGGTSGTGGSASGTGGRASGTGGVGGAIADTGPAAGGGVSSAGGTGAAICAAIDRTSGDLDASVVRSILGDAASSCVLRASDYDRSCRRDADCTAVGEGNACETVCGVVCSSTAINVTAMDAYQADYARTPASYCPGNFCGCPCTGFARCIAGTCQLLACGATVPDASTADIDSGPP